MRGRIFRKTLNAVILSVLFCTSLLSAQTAIVNAVPAVETEVDSVNYIPDVDSGIMDCLFNMGYIIFNQSTDDPVEILLALGRETGADLVLNWSMEEEGVSGSLLNCRTGTTSSSLEIVLDEFEDKYRDKHEMYMEMGVTLCEQLIPDDWN